ncbi:hypothetical protein FIBSPDRAFT_888810 [Athelia psychrophila]|uniref:Uncharacterized protein n=1 Tax=Athelia psychrophila TaxID=1759441 RepID=A0A166MUS2_9AGAM|nr:hypothetical protein FIBSPDRAFT_888810 [Fibularhizoctonia sp. CBS 109695]
MLPDDPLIVPVAPNFKFVIWWHHRNGHICSPTCPIKIWVPDSDSPQNSGSGEVYCPTTGMPISVHPVVQLRFGYRIRTLLEIPLLPPESPVTVATGTQSKNGFQIRILWKIPLLVHWDQTLNNVCVEHGIHLTRGIKLYTKHHDIVVSNPSLWNTYQRMITHNREHLKRELGRVGVMVEDYQDASFDHKAKIRSDCWEAFRENFPSEEDCRDALGLFEQVRQIDEACKGQSIAARQKVFFSTFSKLFQLAQIASNTNGFEFIIAGSGTHILQDAALTEVKVTKGLEGFIDTYFKPGESNFRGNMLAWSCSSKAKEMIEPMDNQGLSVPSIPGTSGSTEVLKSDGCSRSPSGSVGSPSPTTHIRALDEISCLPSSEELAGLPHAKVASLARNVLRSALISAGMRLSGGQHCPWFKVAPVCAEQGIVIREWPVACPFPTETRADKGIEGCTIAGLRLFLESFRASDHPITIKKVDTAAERQALMDGSMPVIVSTVSPTEPKTRHVLFHNNIDKKVPIVPSTPSKSRKLEPLLSSELTDLDVSDAELAEQPAAPIKKGDTATSKTTKSQKRSITVSSGSPSADADSPPKRSKKSRTSESSIEVSEVSEAIKMPKRRMRATTALTGTSKSDGKKKVKPSGNRKAKSKAYIESDDEEMEKFPEELEEAIERPKPRPKRSSKCEEALKGDPPMSPPPSMPSTPLVLALPPPIILNGKLVPFIQNHGPRPPSDPKVQAQLKVLRPNPPAAASRPLSSQGVQRNPFASNPAGALPTTSSLTAMPPVRPSTPPAFIALAGSTLTPPRTAVPATAPVAIEPARAPSTLSTVPVSTVASANLSAPQNRPPPVPAVASLHLHGPRDRSPPRRRDRSPAPSRDRFPLASQGRSPPEPRGRSPIAPRDRSPLEPRGSSSGEPPRQRALSSNAGGITSSSFEDSTGGPSVASSRPPSPCSERPDTYSRARQGAEHMSGDHIGAPRAHPAQMYREGHYPEERGYGDDRRGYGDERYGGFPVRYAEEPRYADPFNHRWGGSPSIPHSSPHPRYYSHGSTGHSLPPIHHVDAAMLAPPLHGPPRHVYHQDPYTRYPSQYPEHYPEPHHRQDDAYSRQESRSRSPYMPTEYPVAGPSRSRQQTATPEEDQ